MDPHALRTLEFDKILAKLARCTSFSAGRELALYSAGGEIFATDNLCTHGHARLCDGFLDGHEIECPLHQGKFDVRTGQPTCAPVTEAIRSYPVKIEGGRVFLAIG